jgi:hypothetical protein
VRIELIHDKDPGIIRSQGDRLTHVRDQIGFRAGVPYCRGHNPSGNNVKVGDQTLGALADIFKLDPLPSPGAHRFGMRTLQGLDASHFIRTHDVGAFSGESGRLFIDRPHRVNALLEHLWVIVFGIQPVATLMGLQIRLILKNAPHSRGKWRARSPVAQRSEPVLRVSRS